MTTTSDTPALRYAEKPIANPYTDLILGDVVVMPFDLSMKLTFTRSFPVGETMRFFFTDQTGESHALTEGVVKTVCHRVLTEDTLHVDQQCPDCLEHEEDCQCVTTWKPMVGSVNMWPLLLLCAALMQTGCTVRPDNALDTGLPLWSSLWLGFVGGLVATGGPLLLLGAVLAWAMKRKRGQRTRGQGLSLREDEAARFFESVTWGKPTERLVDYPTQAGETVVVDELTARRMQQMRVYPKLRPRAPGNLTPLIYPADMPEGDRQCLENLRRTIRALGANI